MLSVILRWETCADGVEVVDVGPSNRPIGLVGLEVGDLFARFRSPRRKPVTHELKDLNNPLVVQLANARTLRHLEAFHGQYGLMHLPLSPRQDALPEWPVASPSAIRSSGLIALLQEMGSGRSTAEQINTVLKDVTLRAQFQSGLRRISLETNNLFNFMRSECVAAAEVGATLVQCPNCQRLFLVGPMTGRRADTRHCSNRCRMATSRKLAAMREQ